MCVFNCPVVPLGVAKMKQSCEMKDGKLAKIREAISRALASFPRTLEMSNGAEAGRLRRVR